MFKKTTRGFQIQAGGRLVISHSPDCPFASVGRGTESVHMRNGHFNIKDTLKESFDLPIVEAAENDGQIELSFKAEPDGEIYLRVNMRTEENGVLINFLYVKSGLNRFWFRLESDKDEKIFGCGQQMSYLNMKGRNYPLWTSEPGIGRDKTTQVTQMADQIAGAGGDYYTVNFPQPTFVSNRLYFVHLDCTSYMAFDFSQADKTILLAMDLPKSLEIRSCESFPAIAEALSAKFGRQPVLPEWIYNGVILGVQGGTETALAKLRFARKNGVNVSALWCQDWEGRRITSFGRRLMWNWQWNEAEYPGLDKAVKDMAGQGVRFMGYINPYLAIDGALYKEGEQHGYFVKGPDDKDYLIDFGEFTCGTVDLTNPAAFEWYKGIIKKEMIGFGMSGWMADFGEYLPYDALLYNGETGKTMHNQWPVLWAKCNREAIDESGRGNDIVFFMRSGFTDVQKYCPLFWAGDQSVDFSRHDGLISAVCGALSAGITAMGLHHSDIGGYTSFDKLVRSKELFLRWAEMAAFTPVMRTHECNRPDENHQFYSDDETAAFLGKMSSIYRKLRPYIQKSVAENAETGLAVQRPLFYHYTADNLWDIQDEYLLGADLLVAPVWKEGETERTLVLPEDKWIHIWSGKEFNGGSITIDAPIGQPPVFYRIKSDFAAIFASMNQTGPEGVLNPRHE